MKLRRKKSTLPGMRELIGLALIFCAVLLAMSLVSYDPTDVSLFTRDSARTVSGNLVGRVGATVADLFFQLFGLASYFLLVPLAAGGWRRLWNRGGPGIGTGILGHGFVMLGTLSLLTLLVGALRVGGEEVLAGGVTGAFLAHFLERYLNTAGAVVFSLALMVLGATVISRLSFGTLLEGSRKVLVELIRRGRTAWTHWRETRRKRKLRQMIVRKHARDKAAGEERTAAAVAPAAPSPASRVAAAARAMVAAAPGVKAAASRPAMVRSRPPEAGPAPEATQKVLPLHGTKEEFVLPPLSLLQSSRGSAAVDDRELYSKAKVITEKYREFGVQGAVVEIHPGPVVTTFEFKPEAGIKYSKVTSLVDDLCLALQAESVRIDRISGKSTVGVEVPNQVRETILLRELLESERFTKSASKLPLAVGKRIDGEVYITDLARMPHLMIAGATGAGKSVCLNALIASILYRATPSEVKFLFIDTKRLELGIYDDIPHLLTRVVTDPKKAANALRWACLEMERRYKMLAEFGVRSIDQYNALIKGGRARERAPHMNLEGVDPIPYIVVVIDELADLMIMSAADVEEGITRLAQMARAVGIHLILSTQRPSVDVITGVIKANFPSRIAFRVSSKVDSRTILDSNGAEKLLGNGDMLFMPPGSSRLIRLHGSYLSEVESAALVQYLKKAARPAYDETVTKEPEKKRDAVDTEEDEMYQDAVRCVLETGVASTSHLQRRLRLGYARAARLVDALEARGIVGPPDGSKQREILVPRDYLQAMEEAGS